MHMGRGNCCYLGCQWRTLTRSRCARALVLIVLSQRQTHRAPIRCLISNGRLFLHLYPVIFLATLKQVHPSFFHFHPLPSSLSISQRTDLCKISTLSSISESLTPHISTALPMNVHRFPSLRSLIVDFPSLLPRHSPTLPARH